MSYGEHAKHQLMGQMRGLLTQLSHLAPHPDRPHHRGALFTALPGWCRLPSAADGLAGQVVMQSLLGAAFADASSLTTTAAPTDSPLDANALMTTLEAYDTYRSETTESLQHKAAHGQGTLARMSGVSIKGSFNLRSHISPGLQAFLEDMPARLKIEGQLAWCLRRLAALEAQPNHPHPIVGLAA